MTIFATVCGTLRGVGSRTLSRLVVVLALVVPSLLPGAAAAQSGESIEPYDVELTIRRDGGIRVVETIAYYFPSPRHGIERRIPVRAPWPDGRVRVWDLDDLTVTSPSGAPVETKRSDRGDYHVVRIGDPDREIDGVHTYVVSYVVDGALRRYEGHDELYWNAVGTEWTVPVERATVRVRAEEPIASARCLAGPPALSGPCATSSPSGTEAAFAHGELRPGEGLAVVVALPRGYASRVGPILRRPGEVHPTFAYAGRPLLAAVATLLLGFVAVALVLRRGRDERWAGQVPGLEPPPGAPARAEPIGAFEDHASAVEWLPGDDMRPALAGVLVDQELTSRHVSTTIVDLAVRGHLRVEEIVGLDGEPEWRFHRLDGDDALMPYERHVKDAVFDGGDATTATAVSRRFGADMPGITDRVMDEVTRRGWFRGRPDTVRKRWTGRGALLFWASIGAAVLLAIRTRYDLVGYALVPPALAFALLNHRMSVRTPAGSAALARLHGFRRYLLTADAAQLRSDDKAGVFSRYLPYAMAFGVTGRWFEVLRDLGVSRSDLAWYDGSGGASPDDLVRSVGAFTAGTSGIASGAGHSSSSGSSHSSSDSSGFSSESTSSGGGGGGGGSSW